MELSGRNRTTMFQEAIKSDTFECHEQDIYILRNDHARCISVS